MIKADENLLRMVKGILVRTPDNRTGVLLDLIANFQNDSNLRWEVTVWFEPDNRRPFKCGCGNTHFKKTTETFDHKAIIACNPDLFPEGHPQKLGRTRKCSISD